MSEGEKALRKKCQILEHNLEQITTMYHQISSQKTLQALDNQVFFFSSKRRINVNQVTERKLQRKTEKIYGLEKQLNELKENVILESNNKVLLINRLLIIRAQQTH